MSGPDDTAWINGARWYRGVRLTVVDHGDMACDWIVTSADGSTVDKWTESTIAEAQQAAEGSADRWASCPDCYVPTRVDGDKHQRCEPCAELWEIGEERERRLDYLNDIDYLDRHGDHHRDEGEILIPRGES